MVFNRGQQLVVEEHWKVGSDIPTVDSVKQAECGTECETAEHPLNNKLRRFRAEVAEARTLNPTPISALEAIKDIRVLTAEYNARLKEYSRVRRSEPQKNQSGLYREIAQLQIRLADLIREKELNENPKPGPCAVLGYTIAEFMEQFGELICERQLRDLDEILRFMAPIRNPRVTTKEASQAIEEIITQLTFGDELKDEWTSLPL
jgi:hypothetical protein